MWQAGPEHYRHSNTNLPYQEHHTRNWPHLCVHMCTSKRQLVYLNGVLMHLWLQLSTCVWCGVTQWCTQLGRHGQGIHRYKPMSRHSSWYISLCSNRQLECSRQPVSRPSYLHKLSSHQDYWYWGRSSKGQQRLPTKCLYIFHQTQVTCIHIALYIERWWMEGHLIQQLSQYTSVPYYTYMCDILIGEDSMHAQ